MLLEPWFSNFWRNRNKEVDFLFHRGGVFELADATWTDLPMPTQSPNWCMRCRLKRFLTNGDEAIHEGRSRMVKAPGDFREPGERVRSVRMAPRQI